MLAKPREALAQARPAGGPARSAAKRRAGNWLAKHLTQALDGLARWRTGCGRRASRELTTRDREIVQPLLARLGDEASLVAELVLGPAVAPEGKVQ